MLGPREKPRCMTTGTIFSKGRDKEVPRNSKQQVDEQLKTNSKSRAVAVGYGPSAKSPGRFRVCVNQGPSDWVIPEPANTRVDNGGTGDKPPGVQ